VMEYVSGTDLKAILKLHRTLDVDNAVGLISQACEGIGFAHQAGLVHCDVKPQNLLVTPQGRLKVVDFGIARVLATIAPDERSEVVWGSPKYFSPEQARGIAPSPASDVYSLGVVLYEALTGELPFSADSADNLARMHREEPPPSPRKLNPRIPGELEVIILKAMSKNPDDRYQDAGLMAIALGNSSGMENAAAIKPLADAIENQTTPAVDIEGENLVWTASEVATRESADSEMAGRGYSLTSQPDVGKSGRRIDFDWITWLLALLALLVAGGLIPFWLWVYYVLNPP
ncbi:MAG: protein kinase, partial [Chloroflexota bacterium]|nr:protein kinase [Chloroflexota bacterium]